MELNFSENIIRLRHERKITQEQLAAFIGVTKASVSKWETKQNLPDILLLPKLAAFFNITIDELLGYEPQLSKEQIQKIYLDLSASFTEHPFDKVMEKCNLLVKKYYSCYPFLFQISALWLNHFMMAETQTRQQEVLNSASDLCRHIISNCRDIGLCNDTILLNATIHLQLGNAGEVIDTLEEILNPNRLSAQSDHILIQAYQMSGQAERADSFTQISMFSHLLSLISAATNYLSIHCENFSVCQETMKRIESIISAYHLELLHPASASLFYLQAAITCCFHDKLPETLNLLEKYTVCIRHMFEAEHLLFGNDGYFNRLEQWYQQSELGGNPPRNKKIIFDSAMQAFEIPAFAAIYENPEFIRLKKSLTLKGKHL
ncbi:MAG: helix-turn-helix transcriptional regulator [Lachnospiraceae bacterium]|nr:helix-turn-helix transcriptional regulator [Lachnospiraceae bacterium]